jgi:ATP-dependent Clp protease ATP-binding subunit ClpB
MYGARPLKRAIQRYVESPLSKRLIAGEFSEGSIIMVDAADNEITFSLANTKRSAKKSSRSKKEKIEA